MLGKNLIQAASGAAGAAAGLGIEDVFSTWLYTGNGSTQTITNGIDLAGEGGLVWTKSRGQAVIHTLIDTARGAGSYLVSSSNQQQLNVADAITSFGSTGYSLGSRSWLNGSADSFASWTFRKAPGFFDVVTYTGNGSNRTIAHSLGSVPGTIIVKRTDTTADWQVYHRSLANTEYMVLNSNAAKATGTTRWNSTTPTSTVFSLGTDVTVNASGGTYVAYLFAHDAGGFGDSGNESVIKCGSYTGNGSTSGPTIDLGWEPQWVMIKRTSGAASWYIYDNMRGVRTGGVDSNLLPDSSQAEDSSFDYLDFNATGFKLTTTSNDHNGNSDTYIYIAIRRGPMKTPTSGTKVFDVNHETEARTTAGWTSLSGFVDDAFWMKSTNVGFNWEVGSRLTVKTLSTNTTAAEQANQYFGWDTQDGIKQGTANYASNSSYSYADYHFRRAPGFFDVVAYTGNGSNPRTINHSLGAIPELLIVKTRSTVDDWWIYVGSTGITKRLMFNSNSIADTTTTWGNVAFTDQVFGVGDVRTNTSATTYIAYLFASCPGVSKVGSYTGTGTTLNVDCGFTSGARFVLIKRTDSTGSWYVWDTARGIVSGNDPYLQLNSTAAEVTSTDYIDPLSSGFQISSTAPAAINASGGTFVFLAIS